MDHPLKSVSKHRVPADESASRAERHRSGQFRLLHFQGVWQRRADVGQGILHQQEKMALFTCVKRPWLNCMNSRENEVDDGFMTSTIGTGSKYVHCGYRVHYGSVFYHGQICNALNLVSADRTIDNVTTSAFLTYVFDKGNKRKWLNWPASKAIAQCCNLKVYEINTKSMGRNTHGYRV